MKNLWHSLGMVIFKHLKFHAFKWSSFPIIEKENLVLQIIISEYTIFLYSCNTYLGLHGSM